MQLTVNEPSYNNLFYFPLYFYIKPDVAYCIGEIYYNLLHQSVAL